MGTDKSLLEKFNQHHQSNSSYEMPPTREPVFSIVHYAGHVKYQIKVSSWDIYKPVKYDGAFLRKYLTAKSR